MNIESKHLEISIAACHRGHFQVHQQWISLFEQDIDPFEFRGALTFRFTPGWRWELAMHSGTSGTSYFSLMNRSATKHKTEQNKIAWPFMTVVWESPLYTKHKSNGRYGWGPSSQELKNKTFDLFRFHFRFLSACILPAPLPFLSCHQHVFHEHYFPMYITCNSIHVFCTLYTQFIYLSF